MYVKTRHIELVSGASPPPTPPPPFRSPLFKITVNQNPGMGEGGGPGSDLKPNFPLLFKLNNIPPNPPPSLPFI